MTAKPKLLFISPRFLLPVDSGGKIRTTQILRGLKGGRFTTILLSPATAQQRQEYAAELVDLADHFYSWPEPDRHAWFEWTRMRHLLSSLPIPVATDFSSAGKALIEQQLDLQPDVVVFDFPHAVVLAPDAIEVPSVLFTHNVEAEIFQRHVSVSANPLKKAVWQNQHRKMVNFENTSLRRFDTVIAVSERDGQIFRDNVGIDTTAVIRTGVDLDYFHYQSPGEGTSVIFTGSMDWLANVDGIDYFQDQIWPLISTELPAAQMQVIGRSPPENLQERARQLGLNWQFSGFVDDVRDYVYRASVFAIPLRVGGGTRLKVFEAMAMGCPIVSTSIGVEGLPLEDGVHYLRADDAPSFAQAVLRLLNDPSLRERIALEARRYVEENFSFREAAKDFEQICQATIAQAKKS